MLKLSLLILEKLEYTLFGGKTLCYHLYFGLRVATWFSTEICMIVSSCDLDKTTCFSLPSNALVVSDERYKECQFVHGCVSLTSY